MVVFAVDGKPGVHYFQRQNDGNLCQHSARKRAAHCGSRLRTAWKVFFSPLLGHDGEEDKGSLEIKGRDGCVNSLSGLHCFLFRVEIVIKWNCLLFKMTVPESGRKKHCEKMVWLQSVLMAGSSKARVNLTFGSYHPSYRPRPSQFVSQPITHQCQKNLLVWLSRSHSHPGF